MNENYINFNRKTLSSSCAWMGKGLHSGEPVSIIIKPSNKGILFTYADESVKAMPENVTQTTRCTCLGKISTIEHLMSALAILEITDCEIELSSPELPALDGASLSYCEELLKIRLVDLGPTQIELAKNAFVLEENNIKIEVKLGTGQWNYIFDTGKRWPGQQTYSINISTEEYLKEIAPARTIGFEEHIEQILQAGLAKGLDEKTALILGQSGYLNEPKFIDEPARHKLLDLIGDFYLTGIPVRYLDVTAICSGHQTNVKMAHQIYQAIKVPAKI